MIMGIAVWFFPKADKSDRRYSPALITLVYWLMVTGTSFRFIFEVIDAYVTLGISDYVITASSAIQILAAVIYVYTMWGRIRPVGSQVREAKGERF
jgi:hypothetical protein